MGICCMKWQWRTDSNATMQRDVQAKHSHSPANKQRTTHRHTPATCAAAADHMTVSTPADWNDTALCHQQLPTMTHKQCTTSSTTCASPPSVTGHFQLLPLIHGRVCLCMSPCHQHCQSSTHVWRSTHLYHVLLHKFCKASLSCWTM